MPDLSRLNQLLLLLEEGSSSLIREAAAQHLGGLVMAEAVFMLCVWGGV